MTRVAWDGHPKTHGPDQRAQTGHRPSYSVAGLREGLVLARYFPDQDGNRSRTHLEYTIRDCATAAIYPGARYAESASGLDGGSETTLRPAEKAERGLTTAFTAARELDGDLVLFGFLDGSPDRPIILGVLPHPRAKYSGAAKDGERRYTLHKGTSIEIKDDGTYQISRGKTTITLLANEDVELRRGDKTLVKLTADQLDLAAQTVNVAEATDQFMLLGTFVRQQQAIMHKAIAAACKAAITPATVLTAMQAISDAMTAFEAAMATRQNGVSTKAKVG